MILVLVRGELPILQEQELQWRGECRSHTRYLSLENKGEGAPVIPTLYAVALLEHMLVPITSAPSSL